MESATKLLTVKQIKNGYFEKYTSFQVERGLMLLSIETRSDPQQPRVLIFSPVYHIVSCVCINFLDFL